MCARPRAWAAETWASTASASRRCGRRWIQRGKGAPRCRLSPMPVKKILIADDSSTARHVLFQMLARHGYRCILAETAREAMDKAKTENPDLILLDVVMPDMSGFELRRRALQARNVAGARSHLRRGGDRRAAHGAVEFGTRFVSNDSGIGRQASPVGAAGAPVVEPPQIRAQFHSGRVRTRMGAV